MKIVLLHEEGVNMCFKEYVTATNTLRQRIVDQY